MRAWIQAAVCLLLVFFATCLGASADASQEVTFPDATTVIPGHGSTTYLDLARMVLPDLVVEEVGYSGSKVVGVRSLGEDFAAGEPPKRIGFYNFQVLPVRSAGKDRLVMLLDLTQADYDGEAYAVLALYDLSGEPKLLDAVNVGLDGQSWFYDPARLSVNSGTDVLVTGGAHYNSNQAYKTTALLLARNDRFELVDTIFTFDDSACSFQRTQQLNLTLQSASGSAPFAEILATVEETTVATGGDCEDPIPAPPSRRIQVTYRWDEAAQRYLPDSDAFNRLYAEDQQRF